jgi:hypothetical protein
MKIHLLLKKTFFGLLVLSFFVVSSQVYAEQLCSNTSRWTTNKQTYAELYKNSLWDFGKSYVSSIKPAVNWNQEIEGRNTWYDNKKWGCGNGWFIGDELSAWDTRWDYNDRRLKAWVPNVTSSTTPISKADVTKMQDYINKECWLWITTDGLLGKKTINAIKACIPPCDGDCDWSTFTTLAPVLFQDAEWKKPIKTGNVLVSDFDPSAVMYINPNASQLNGKLPNTLWLWVITTASCQDFAPDGKTPVNKSDAPDLATSKEWQTANCSCKPGYKKEAIQFEWDKSWDQNKTYAICRKCDPERCNCGVKLNTNVPFIGRCIMYGMTNDPKDNAYTSGDNSTVVVNPLNAFPVLMTGIVKILMTVILLICFGALIVAGVMMTTEQWYETGKGLIWKVVWAVALLWTSGVILYLINPNFFF